MTEKEYQEMNFKLQRNQQNVKFVRITKNNKFLVTPIFNDFKSSDCLSLSKKDLIPIIALEQIPTHHLKTHLDILSGIPLDVEAPFFSTLSHNDFDNIMLWYGFYKENYSELGNRILSRKARKYGFDKIISTLIPSSLEIKNDDYETIQKEKKLLFELAEKYNFTLTDNSDWMDD